MSGFAQLEKHQSRLQQVPGFTLLEFYNGGLLENI